MAQVDKEKHTLICDYLQMLGVPHTQQYTDQRFEQMPFKSLFGMAKLLEEYGVDSEGYHLEDKSELDRLTPPFIAKLGGGYVIVKEVQKDKVTYLTQGIEQTAHRPRFEKSWDGNVFLSFPHKDAKEPEYGYHARIEFFMRAKKWVLLACALFLFLYLYISRELYGYISTYFITAIDLMGLYFTYLLVQKSLNIKNKAADKVCGVLQAGGCDSILEMKASKFFGLFGWSEVGFAYFSVSLLSMLLFPETLPTLALINILCLPFTCWSIWYQRFRAHRWCTLCVSVQCSLWLLFFSYLLGGWVKLSWPPTFTFIVLGVAYVCVMLAVNALMPLIEKDK